MLRNVCVRVIAAAAIVIVATIIVTRSDTELYHPSEYNTSNAARTTQVASDKLFGIKPEGWTAVFTGVLALFTAVLTGVSSIQIYYLDRSEKIARRTAQAAKIAAVAARDQVRLAKDASETPLRAYLDVDEIVFVSTGIRITILNKGRTPAQGIVVRYSRDYSVDGVGYENSGVIDTGIQIAPESADYVTIEDRDIRSLQPVNDDIAVLFDVTIDYDDWFGNRRQCDLTFRISARTGITENRRYRAN